MEREIPTIATAHRLIWFDFKTIFLYDHHCKLIISAAGAPADLYQGSALKNEFQRTVSRLIEMQSKEYLNGKLWF